MDLFPRTRQRINAFTDNAEAASQYARVATARASVAVDAIDDTTRKVALLAVALTVSVVVALAVACLALIVASVPANV